MYTKILAAVNEHLNSEISAQYALNLAKACEAKLFLCFIAEKNMPRLSFDKAEDAIKRLFIKAKDMNLQVESLTQTGEPVKEIRINEKRGYREEILCWYHCKKFISASSMFCSACEGRSCR
jgi:hypothetical protein